MAVNQIKANISQIGLGVKLSFRGIERGLIDEHRKAGPKDQIIPGGLRERERGLEYVSPGVLVTSTRQIPFERRVFDLVRQTGESCCNSLASASLPSCGAPGGPLRSRALSAGGESF